jgi:hypothetical protein
VRAATASRPAGHPASHAEKRAGRLEKTGWPTGRPAGPNRLADRLAGRPADRPDHSVECAGCSKSGSGGLFLPIFFADGRKDVLFLPPRGPPQPPPPRQRPRPLKPTTFLPGTGSYSNCLVPVPPTYGCIGPSLRRPAADLIFAKWAFNIPVVRGCRVARVLPGGCAGLPVCCRVPGLPGLLPACRVLPGLLPGAAGSAAGCCRVLPGAAGYLPSRRLSWSVLPGCCRVTAGLLPGCCRVLPGTPALTSSQLVSAAGVLPGYCRVAAGLLPGCRVIAGLLPGCRVAGCCRVVGVLPGRCRVRLPGCRGQGSNRHEAPLLVFPFKYALSKTAFAKQNAKESPRVYLCFTVSIATPPVSLYIFNGNLFS